jgi:probable F420-dependent oxidoreductase
MTNNKPIQIGVNLAMFWSETGHQEWVEVAKAADEYEYDIVWGNDHVTFPAEVRGSHLGDDEPPSFARPDTDVYDVFQVLAHLAGQTDDVRFGTNICVAPYRHPIMLTNLAFTLSALSEERFELGIGAGWLETEFEALDVPFSERGSRTDEFLEVFTRARSESLFSFEGPHHQFQEVSFNPRPSDSDTPKLWIGGESGAAIRRMAEFGDGWTINGTPDHVADGRQRLEHAWDDYDRAGEPPIAVGARTYLGENEKWDTSNPLVGSPDSILDSIDEYVKAGATHLVLGIVGRDSAERVEQVERFGEEVLPEL